MSAPPGDVVPDVVAGLGTGLAYSATARPDVDDDEEELDDEEVDAGRQVDTTALLALAVVAIVALAAIVIVAVVALA